MKLSIETWLEGQRLPSAASPLLTDAVICYKNGAYRASLIMSYLGFLSIIKDRIMTGTKPGMLPQHKWDDKLTGLRDENTWEAEINSALQKKEITTGSGASRVRTEDPFFPISEGLRQQLTYWKDRRNDCAHNKDNIIISAHVEAFWTFIISNLPKMTIEGGKGTLLNRLSSYYDRNQTPAGTPLTPIVTSIHTSIEVSELPIFWNDAFAVIDSTYDFFNSNQNQFIAETLKLSDDIVKQSLLTFLKAEKHKLLGHIDENPGIIQLLDYTPQEIRQLWKTEIRQRNNFLKIYASLLRNSLIPDAEINEANEFFSTKMQYTNDALDRDILSQNGFDKWLYQKLFIEPDRSYFKFWEILNENATVYRQYIEFSSIDKPIVQFICEELGKSWHSYFLAQALDNLFSTSATKKSEFKAIAVADAIQIPASLPSLL
jgi:hypothetical protein